MMATREAREPPGADGRPRPAPEPATALNPRTSLSEAAGSSRTIRTRAATSASCTGWWSFFLADGRVDPLSDRPPRAGRRRSPRGCAASDPERRAPASRFGARTLRAGHRSYVRGGRLSARRRRVSPRRIVEFRARLAGTDTSNAEPRAFLARREPEAGEACRGDVAEARGGRSRGRSEARVAPEEPRPTTGSSARGRPQPARRLPAPAEISNQARAPVKGSAVLGTPPASSR